MDLKGYRYDNLETRAFIRVVTEQYDTGVADKTSKHQRPVKMEEK
jgi:hypothetical protein